MIKGLLYKIFGSRNDRVLKRYTAFVVKINALEDKYKLMSDIDLSKQTSILKERLSNKETVDAILVDAFAVCREVSRRVLGMRHFDVQLIGGLALHFGNIAEMKTGEGKTLVATLPAYLHALSGESVHIVTVNDYLAKRDATDMEPLYSFLGITVGINLSDISMEEKKTAYSKDVIYGTNNEYGFDYLRDNMVFDIKYKVQPKLSYAILDEVDSILIDEARTPLIISGSTVGDHDLCKTLDCVPSQLIQQDTIESEGDFFIDEKENNVLLSESGHEKVESILCTMGLLDENDSLYNVSNISTLHHLFATLKAHNLYLKDRDYVVQNDSVIIVDEFTGRLMEGRRWSDGIHQAIEVKENVTVQSENQTLASITFQNFFRIYEKLSGMTGTADTEAYEFKQIYNLEVIVIPTNKPMTRIDYDDEVYFNVDTKYDAIISQVKECHKKQQPVLIGTTSVENSEVISRSLHKANLKHEVLNAKQHEREADIIVQAGKPGSITVATNMAGRGTDIVLGGNYKSDANIDYDQWKQYHQTVLDAGGLMIIGTERHESRRIDNQLRGRSGRQGDSGASKFYLSLDDPLLSVFGGDRMKVLMNKFGMKPDEMITHKWVTRAIESAQRKVEAYHFDIRKQLIEYDDVFNKQRAVIYAQRNDILLSNELLSTVKNMLSTYTTSICDRYNEDGKVNLSTVTTFIAEQMGIEIVNCTTVDKLDNYLYKQVFMEKVAIYHKYIQGELGVFLQLIANDSSSERLLKFLEDNDIDFTMIHHQLQECPFVEALALFEGKFEEITSLYLTRLLRTTMLQYVDYFWQEHLTTLENLRQVIYLRGYAQKDPKREFEIESYKSFESLLFNVNEYIIRAFLTLDFSVYSNKKKDLSTKRIKRNQLCPCNSGKKYKHCHGKLKK